MQPLPCASVHRAGTQPAISIYVAAYVGNGMVCDGFGVCARVRASKRVIAMYVALSG